MDLTQLLTNPVFTGALGAAAVPAELQRLLLAERSAA